VTADCIAKVRNILETQTFKKSGNIWKYNYLIQYFQTTICVCVCVCVCVCGNNI